MWGLGLSVWASPEATTAAGQQESSTLSSIWSGVRNLFTQDEIAIELGEMRAPLLEAPPVGDVIPRLLSANFEAELDQEEIDLLHAEWDETPAVEEDMEFMSVEWVDDFAAREAAIDAEFAPTIEQIELMNMELPELAGGMGVEEMMVAGDVAVAMADVGSLLVPMEVELGAEAGPIAGAVSSAVAGTVAAAAGWTTLATVAAVAAVAAGVFVGAWYLAVWISGMKSRNHQWKLKYEDFNWIKKGTIGWIALGVDDKQLFYPFICTGIVDYDAEKYNIRFLDIFRISHVMEMHFDHNVILMLPFSGARQEQWVSLETYLKTPYLRDVVHNPGMKVWPYCYKINAIDHVKFIPFYRKFAIGTIVRMRKTARIGYVSKLPSLKNPVYKITGKLDQWSALPSQFDYLVPGDAPTPQPTVPTSAAPPIEPWMETSEHRTPLEHIAPKDMNGKNIYEADRVFSLTDLTFSNVDSTRKTSVVTYNTDTEQTHTYIPENLIVVQYYDSEADIYRKAV